MPQAVINQAPRTSPLLLGALAVVFLAAMALSGYDPSNRADWLLENVLVVVTLPALYWAYRKALLSNASFIMIFIFMVFHELGAHYTYSEVPYEAWLQDHFQWSLNQAMGWERNQFDRLIHLLFGLLWYVPIVQVLKASLPLSRNWIAAIAILIVIAASTIYELIEWSAAAVFGGELGMAYLGTQGDVWDAHKDITLAIAGSLFASLLRRLLR